MLEFDAIWPHVSAYGFQEVVMWGDVIEEFKLSVRVIYNMTHVSAFREVVMCGDVVEPLGIGPWLKEVDLWNVREVGFEYSLALVPTLALLHGTWRCEQAASYSHHQRPVLFFHRVLHGDGPHCLKPRVKEKTFLFDWILLGYLVTMERNISWMLSYSWLEQKSKYEKVDW